MSKKIWSILLQTLIGVLLMRVAMRYLQNHPAEKVGIFPTFEYVYQKVAGIGKRFQGRSSGEFGDLTQFKSSFGELQSIAVSPACAKAVEENKISKIEIAQVLEDLENTSAENFSANKSKYIALFNRMNEEINRYCEK